MPSNQAHDDLVKSVIAFGQILVVVVGWVVVSRGNDKREKRKEIRTLLNEIRQMVNQVEVRAIEYYQLTPEDTRDLAVQLKQQLKQISTLTTTVTKLSSSFELSDQVADLRKKVTGQDFDSATRVPRKGNDTLFGEIAIAAAELIDSMENVFSATYA